MASGSDAALARQAAAGGVDDRDASVAGPVFPPHRAASETLVARVAHELNNPLDGILRYINLALRTIGDDAPPNVVDYLERSRKGLLRMAQITGELLAYARADHAGGDDADVNRVVEEAVRSMHDRAGERGIVISAGYRDQDMPTVAGSKLYQVCCNLIKNAIDAMPGGGMLTINTGVVGGCVVLRFEDTGVGLPDDVERVFEPFYTSKEADGGTGLGLAICREYIEGIGGTVTAAHRPGGGAVFTVRFPVDRGGTTGGAARPEPADARNARDPSDAGAPAEPVAPGAAAEDDQ